VLTISKPLSAGQAQSYHQKEFTAKEQNYWSQKGVIQGEWQGRVAAQLGLAGPVSAADFAKLSQGQHPQTGEQLVRQRASYEYKDADGRTITTMEHRAGWDATFSAPKSVSLTALVGGDERLREAHRESVRVALDQLERYTQARIGGNRPPETTCNFVVAKFEHDTARPVDGYVAPQLHTHAVIFNVTERENGQPRAIQPQSLFASQQFATAVYQSELTYRLRRFGYEITTGRSGAPEIKGYTQEYIDASSPRSQQIRDYLERTGRSGKEAAEIAAHSTRDRKGIHSLRDVMAAHRKLAAEFGNQAEAVVRAARERVHQRQKDSFKTIDLVRESLTFARDKNFEREAVVDERALFRDALRRGMGEVTYPQVRANLDARLVTGEFQIVERLQNVPARWFTTAKTIAAEREILGHVRQGQQQVAPILPRQQAIAFSGQPPHLNHAQRNVIEDVLSSRDRVQGLQGFAGVGKTSTLAVIRNAAESRGYKVSGLAPTSRAARQLTEVGVESRTLQAFLARTPEPAIPEQKRLYFIDESSLASTNQMREFLSRLGPQDRVLLIGDIRQHQGVEAGRPFEQLQAAGMQTARLDEIVRQQDPTLKSAVELLAAGHVPAALNALQEQGRVKEIPNREERVLTIAKSYVEFPDKTLIVSPDNASRRELNAAVRRELKRTGVLAREDHQFRVLVQRPDMTGAERSWASHYEIGDIVRYARGSRAIGIEGGSYATVTRTSHTGNQLTIEKANGQLRTYDPRRLTGVNIYQATDREFAVGDRIQFTAPDKSLGVANRDLGIVESISPEGHVLARLDGNGQIEFNARNYRHFDHGYAVTSHSAQGLTAERVLVHADTGVHPDLLNSRFAYVSVSRASHEATLFTDNMKKLAPQLSTDISKTSALEIAQTSTLAQGLGIAF
jgi:conjugative relaxase-like TrwC/TraI family protein